jgi:hypothetical protein
MAITVRQSNTLFARTAAACATLLAAGVVQSASVRADSCDFIKYDPPRGWTAVNVDGGRVYGRPDQAGVIMLQAKSFSYNVKTAFSDTWRELVEIPIPGASQKFTPQEFVQGDFAIAIGSQPVMMNDKVGVAMLTVILGKGRKVAIAGLAKNDEARREIVTFTDAVKLDPKLDPTPSASTLVGRWWKDAGRNYYWLEFTDGGLYSYEAPASERVTGTYRVEGNRITLGRATSRAFHLTCVGGEVRLEIEAEGGYWASPKRDCSSLRASGSSGC